MQCIWVSQSMLGNRTPGFPRKEEEPEKLEHAVGVGTRILEVEGCTVGTGDYELGQQLIGRC